MKNVYVRLLVSAFFFVAVSVHAMELIKTDDEKIREAYFKDVPEKYKSIVESHLNFYTSGSEEKLRKMCHFKAMASQEKHRYKDEVLPFGEYSGYCMFQRNYHGDFCTGPTDNMRGSTNLSLKREYVTALNKPDLLNKLVQDYKIHLMPKGPIYEDFDEILTLLKEDKELRKAVVTFKFLLNFNDIQLQEDSDKKQEIYPKIVIYCAPGKENAQFVLDRFSDQFKDKEGSGMIPRYSQEVTSYISYAQGNGDDKKISEFNDFFEPDKIHYKLDWITWFKWLIGKHPGYHLQIPGKQNQEGTESSNKSFKKLFIPILCGLPVFLLIK